MDDLAIFALKLIMFNWNCSISGGSVATAAAAAAAAAAAGS